MKLFKWLYNLIIKKHIKYYQFEKDSIDKISNYDMSIIGNPVYNKGKKRYESEITNIIH